MYTCTASAERSGDAYIIRTELTPSGDEVKYIYSHPSREREAERVLPMAAFLSGNPPRRWVWFGWGVMAASAAMAAMRWAV